MLIQDIKIAIVSSSFRGEVKENLEKHCIQTLQKKGLTNKQIDLFEVPGSLEIPLLVKKLAKKKMYDAIITFGAIVKGKTYHFEQIANECARMCMQVSYDYEIPVIFEVLAVYNLQDALDRAEGKKGYENKGEEAALTALAIIKKLEEVQ